MLGAIKLFWGSLNLFLYVYFSGETSTYSYISISCPIIFTTVGFAGYINTVKQELAHDSAESNKEQKSRTDQRFRRADSWSFGRINLRKSAFIRV